jgi:hypothetical protein
MASPNDGREVRFGIQPKTKKIVKILRPDLAGVVEPFPTLTLIKPPDCVRKL